MNRPKLSALGAERNTRDADMDAADRQYKETCQKAWQLQGRQAVRIFELRREWWFPLIITLWERVGDGDDPFKGHFELWHKRGDFVRRHTAERYQEALEAMA